MFLRKNSGIEKKKKLICGSFPRKTSRQPLLIRLSPEFQQLFNPYLLITNLKREAAQRTKHKIVPRAFLHILVYVLEWKCLLCTRVEVEDTLYCLGSC